jgi:hypothetical protein
MATIAGALGLASFTSSAQAATFEFNRALNRPSWQTSTGFGGVPSRANDGNTDGAYFNNSVSHTLEEYQPYWEVDLGGSYLIDTLELFNRTDCCKDRLRDLFVFFSDSPMNLRGASDTFQQEGVTSRLIFGQANDHHVIQLGKRARYVRIQLSGTGYLSLAEVKALEHLTVDGPAALAGQTSWVATGVFTPASAFTLASLDGGLQSFHRGFDGKLHIADDMRFDSAIPGSPLVTADAPAVAVDPDTKQAFVAVRGADGNLYIGTATPPVPPLTPRSWSWQVIAATEAPPSLIVVDGKVVVAWLQGQYIRSTWRLINGGSWDTPTVHIDAITPPTLARNKSNAIGIGFIRWDGSINFVKGTIDTAAHWGAVQTITGWSNGGRVGVAAWGDLFMVSALGGDARPYVAIQQPGGAWNGFEAAWGANDIKLMEAPTLAMFDGMILVFGRDQNKALRYWMRNPNTIAYRYAPGLMWLGGRIVGGWGTGATPPALAAMGSSTVWGILGGPSEFFVATRGIGDQQIYAFNVGRFVALDILGSFGISLRGNDSLPQLDVRMIGNLFEQMVGFLALPGANAWTTVNHNPSCSSSQWAVQLLLHPDAAGQTRAYQCPPVIYINSSYLQAFHMFHEWMHMDHARRGLASWTDYPNAFKDPMPKLCASDGDCGTDKCENKDDSFGWFGDPTIRRWMGLKVCAVDAEDRPQGHATYYALESSEHDFIETAQRYRFEGEKLKESALHDYFNGNQRLWLMYAWLRDHYFDGIEYNGDGDTGGVKADRNLGWWGMPNK